MVWKSYHPCLINESLLNMLLFYCRSYSISYTVSLLYPQCLDHVFWITGYFFSSLNSWSREELKYTMVNWPWQIGISMMILTLLPRVNAKWVMLATTVTALRSIAESLGHLKFSAFQKFQFLNFFKESQK